MRPLSALPLSVKKALRNIGRDIRRARLLRRIPMDLMAQRACISRTTLTKVEKGDPTVALGIYASVLFVLGLVSNLANVFATEKDTMGQILAEENLPKRIRFPKRVPSEEDEND